GNHDETICASRCLRTPLWSFRRYISYPPPVTHRLLWHRLAACRTCKAFCDSFPQPTAQIAGRGYCEGGESVLSQVLREIGPDYLLPDPEQLSFEVADQDP